MDLDDSLPVQMRALIDWMNRLADKESPPSAVEWAAIIKGVRARADFLDRYVLPEVEVDPYALPARPGYLRPVAAEA